MAYLFQYFRRNLSGILIFGKRTRELGEGLNAHTFPELMAKRFNSNTIQTFAGGLIFITMPLYAAAVMIGGARFLEVNLGLNYEMAILIFGLITAAYVFSGGLKGVVYTDAFQGSLMFAGMLVLIFFTYISLGGISTAHTKLAALSNLVPPGLAAGGHQGWDAEVGISHLEQFSNDNYPGGRNWSSGSTAIKRQVYDCKEQ